MGLQVKKIQVGGRKMETKKLKKKLDLKKIIIASLDNQEMRRARGGMGGSLWSPNCPSVTIDKDTREIC